MSGMKNWSYKAISISILSTLPFMAGCETDEQDPQAMDIQSPMLGTSIDLGESMNGKPVKFKVGQSFSIKLEGNATTGYSWMVKDYNEKVLKLTINDYNTTSGNIGAPGIFVFGFEAIAPGESEVLLEYVRPWEKQKTVSKNDTYHIDVSVESKKK